MEIAVEGLFRTKVEVSAHLEPAGIQDERLDNFVNLRLNEGRSRFVNRGFHPLTRHGAFRHLTRIS